MEWTLYVVTFISIIYSAESQCPAGCHCSEIARNAKCKMGMCEPEVPIGFDSSVVDLELTAYNLTRLDEQVFRKLRSLTDLSLIDDNILFVLPDAFQSLENLTYLSLRDNCFTDIPPTTFSSNNHLVTLDLSENHRLKLPMDDEFLNSTSIQALILDNCYNLSPYVDGRAKVINFDVFQSLSNLKELSLKNNRIESLDVTEDSEPLNIITIYLTNNSLTTIPQHFFTPLPFIESLYLDSNAIQFLPSGLFDPLIKLNKLFLQNNALQEISSKSFLSLRKLETLDLRNNKLGNFTDKVFEGLGNLRVLSLSGNSLYNLNYNVVEPLKSLEVIDVSNTSLNEVHLRQLVLLDNPAQIIAKDINLSCDCELYKSWLDSKSDHKLSVSCKEITEVTNNTYIQFECDKTKEAYTLTVSIVLVLMSLVLIGGIIFYVRRKRRLRNTRPAVKFQNVIYREQVYDIREEEMFAQVRKNKNNNSEQ